MMVNANDVITFHGLRPADLHLQKEDEEKLLQIVENCIKQAESLIKSYTNNEFINEVPPAVQNVCIRLVSNMITLAIQRRDSPIIKVNDWTVTTGSSEVFTSDLKEDLTPFIKEKSYKSDTVSFYAITGD